MTLQQRYEQALAAARAADSMSARTQNKRWKAVFAIEDEIKSGGGWK